MQKLGIALLTLGLLSGCASEVAMRSTSLQAASMLATYRQAMGSFATAQNGLNSATRARVYRLRDIAAANRSEVELRLTAWQYDGNKDALSRFKIIAAISSDEILSRNTALTPLLVEASPALKFDKAPVDGVIKQLVTLSKPPSPLQRIEQAVAFHSKLIDTLDASTARATEQAETTAQATSPPSEAPN